MRSLPFLCLALLLCQCGSPSAPQCHRVPRKSRLPAETLISEARQAWTTLGRRPSPAARTSYNQAVTKLFDQLRCGTRNWQTRARQLGTSLDPSSPLGRGLTLAEADALVPAAKVPLGALEKRHTEEGLGLPLVAWKSRASGIDRPTDFTPPTGIPFNLTVFLDFSSSPPAWRFLRPSDTTRVELGSRSEALAIDWTARSALYWYLSDLDDLDLFKVFLPTRFTDHTGLFFAAPYDPEKIPVVFVHGLNSSPGTFKQVYNHLTGQKWFRQRYQALFFSYPTGIGWPYNAAKFRRLLRNARDLAAGQGPLDQWNQMVIVSHSMGGVIAQASLVDPGQRFYEASYRQPLDKLQVSASTREAIASVRLYEPLQSPSRVIFMATPHRGSPTADRFFVHWMSSIVRLPKTLTIDLATAALDEIRRAIQHEGETRPPLTSFGTLTPRYTLYQALNDSPFRPGLHYHSIIGNRGHGTARHTSDGIVPYWSSHLDGAESEKMVPADHTLTDHPAVISEVSRILQEHLKKP